MFVKNVYTVIAFFLLKKIPHVPNLNIQKRAVFFVTALNELAKEGYSFAQFPSNSFVPSLY